LKSLQNDIFITTIYKYLVIIINFIGGAILARLLSPDDFGIVAIVLVIQSFFFLFGDFGIGIGVIQSKELKSKDYSQIFSFTFYTSILLSFIFIGFGWFLFRVSLVEFKLMMILSLNIFFFIINIVPSSILKKQKRFKAVGFIEFISFVLSWLFCFLMIYFDFGYYSIVLRFLFFSIVSFFLVVVNLDEKLKFNFGLIGVKKIYNFSIFQFLFNFSNFFSRNFDQLMIKKHFNLNVLGLYNRAYNLMFIPVGSISGILSSVLLPHLNELSHTPDEFIKKYKDYLKKVMILGFTIGLVLFTYSYEILVTVYGQKWIGAVNLFKFMGILSGIQVLISFSGLGFQVLGKSKEMFYSSLILTLLVLAFISFSIHLENILYIIYSLILSYFLGGLFIYYVLMVKIFKLRFYEYFKLFGLPFLSFIVSLVIMELVLVVKFSEIIKSFVFILNYCLFFIIPNRKIYLSFLKLIKL